MLIGRDATAAVALRRQAAVALRRQAVEDLLLLLLELLQAKVLALRRRRLMHGLPALHAAAVRRSVLQLATTVRSEEHVFRVLSPRLHPSEKPNSLVLGAGVVRAAALF